jgi:invasion protein IalB
MSPMATRTLPAQIPWTWAGAAMARSLLALLVMLLSVAAGQAQRAPTNKPPNAWVKLCEKSQVKGKDKDGKELTKDVDACVTLTEHTHPDNGMLMVSAKYHQVKVDGQEKQSLQLTVPLGVTLSAGLGVTVFPKDLWNKLLKGEKLRKAEEEKLKGATVPLTYTFCSEFGCNAEVEASADLLNKLKAGAGFVVQSAHVEYGRLAQPVSLAGFSQALAGPATNTREYARSRKELIGSLKRGLTAGQQGATWSLTTEDRAARSLS